MAGVKDIVLQVSQLTKLEELDAVTAAVNSRSDALRLVDGGSPRPNFQERKSQTPADALKEMQAVLDSMRPQGDNKTT